LGRITQGHDLVTLDTSLWIYHLEGHPTYQSLASEVLRDVSAGRCRALVSDITLLELLVHPLRLGLEDVADEYEVLLTHFPNARLVSIGRPIVLNAAALRAKYGLRAPDAIIAATGLLGGSTLLVTNDERWKRVDGIGVAYLKDFL
jgi:predicted nucleic acid-binding protein